MEKRNYSKKEDALILKYVQKDFDNLSIAFRKAAKALNRTESGISYRWYHVLSNPSNDNYIGSACFMALSAEKRISNRKVNSKYSKSKQNSPGFWSELIKLIRKFV
jgi:hypothetical protein